MKSNQNMKINLLLLIFLLLISCSKSKNYKIYEINGVKHISNKNVAMCDSINLKLTLLTTINYKDEISQTIEGKYGFRIIGNKYYLLDYDNNCIKIFNSNGKYLSRFLNKGQGPGETLNLYSFFVKDDTIMVDDQRSGKIEKFNSKGENIGRQRFTSFKVPQDLVKFEKEKFIEVRTDFKPFPTRDGGSRIETIQAYNSSNKHIKTLYQNNFDIFFKKSYDPLSGVNIFLGNKKIYLNEKSKNKFEIDIYNSEFKHLSRITKNYHQIKRTKEDLKKTKEDYKNIKTTNIINYKKSITKLEVDKYKNIWVFTWNENGFSDKRIVKPTINIFKNGIYFSNYYSEEEITFMEDKLIIFDTENFSIRIYSYEY